MKPITRYNHDRPALWDPFFSEFERGLDRYFGRQSPATTEEPTTPRLWAPLTDITEDAKEYLVKAELPDVKKEDVKVTVEGNALCITGERTSEKEDKDKTYHRVERRYGSFERIFTLPANTDPAGVTAEFKDGLLVVRLPKTEKAAPAPVEVKVT